MDDFIKTGPPEAAQAVMECLERVAQLKITGLANKHDSWVHSSPGWLHDPDRHRDFAGRSAEHCKPSKLPGATPQTHDLTPLDPSEQKLYRRVVGRFLYCSAHPGDFAFTL